MSLTFLLCLFAYLLIGIFVAAAMEHFDDSDFDMMCVAFWPIYLAVLLIIAVFWIPYKLGEWVGHLFHDLIR